MKGSPMYRNFGIGDPKKKGDKSGDVDFSHTQSPTEKAKQDLDMMKLGSRFDESGKRKKGDAKKMAKMTRKWTGLDQQKYDRDTKRQKTSFRGKGGQEGLDKLKKNLQKKNRRKGLGKVIKSGWDRLTGKTVGKGGQAGSGFKPNCKEGNCGAFD